MTSSFNIINANDLPDMQMIAGDEQDFTYNVYTSASTLIDLNGATVTVNIFRYGDPSYAVVVLTGNITGSPLGEFTATLTSGCSISMSGVYTQQPVVLDYLGKKHIPSQGKIIVLPSPNV
jgi:hypothetical protein